MNPMIWKELRQRMRERRAWIVPVLYLLVLGGTVALAYYFKTADLFGFSEFTQPQGAEIGLSIFFTVIFTQMALLLLMAPVFSAGSLTIEKEQRTLGGLLTSLLTPADIWWGKFVSSMLFLLLLLVSALPVLSLAFALGGIGPWEVAKAMGVTFLILANICAMGLYCSSYFRRSVHSTAVSYGVVIVLTVVTFVIFVLMASWWEHHRAHLRQYEDQAPDFLLAPLYFNPFFPLVAVFTNSQEFDYHYWLPSLLCFTALGLLAAALALRNIERRDDQV